MPPAPAWEARSCGRPIGSERKRIIREKARGRAFWKTRVDQAFELPEAVFGAGEPGVSLRQRRCGGAHDLPPRVVELKPEPVQEKDCAAVGCRISVAVESVVDEVSPWRIKPGGCCR